MTQTFFIAIEGAIGVGKTTLARLLQPHFGGDLLLEAFEENPFLSDFYTDRARYAFQTQMFFLLSRYRQRQEVPASLARGSLIADYMFAKDSLFAHLTLDGDELDMYERLYDVLAERITLPDLVIYLRAETDVLMMRIAMRDRTYEREMDRSYIEMIRQAYEQYFSAYTEAPLLAIDTDHIDYVRDSTALDAIEGQIRTALGVGAFQQSLPQMETAARSHRWTVPVRNELHAPRQEAVEGFLAASEAMGRVGAALVDSAEGWSKGPTAELGAAVEDALKRLQRLALTVGLELQERQ